MTKDKTKKRYFPSSFLVIMCIMLIFIIASWIGQAVTKDINGIGFLDVFSAIWHGFSSKVDVILFIFSIGGTLGVMTKIKAIDAGIGALVNKLGNKVWLLIPVLMLLFGLGGSTYGMWEETVAFIPVLIPVFKKAGYGPFTAILVILIGAGTGCLASTINPFAVGAAVGGINGADNPIANAQGTIGDSAALKFSTGTMQGTRWISFFVFEIVSISAVTWTATRYKKASLAKMTTESAAIKAAGNNKLKAFFTRGRVVEGINTKLIDKRFKEAENIKFTTKRKISLALFLLSFVLMILLYLPWGNWIDLGTSQGIKTYNKSMWWFASTSKSGFANLGDWYFTSVASLFLIATIIIFAINFKSFRSDDENAEEGFISSYMTGVKDVVSVCLLIATAGGLGIILDSTGFGVLIAKNASKGLNTWMGFGITIFFISIVLSFIVPSTSGFAAAFMPIFGQIAVSAFGEKDASTAMGLAMIGFLFANGLANLVTPTSAALMGYTSYAGIPYNVWIKQTWKIVLVLFVVSFILILAFSAAAASGSSLF